MMLSAEELLAGGSLTHEVELPACLLGSNGTDSRVVLREPLIAVVPVDHPLASADRPLRPADFEGQPVIGYHPRQSRYFH